MTLWSLFPKNQIFCRRYGCHILSTIFLILHSKFQNMIGFWEKHVTDKQTEEQVSIYRTNQSVGSKKNQTCKKYIFHRKTKHKNIQTKKNLNIFTKCCTIFFFSYKRLKNVIWIIFWGYMQMLIVTDFYFKYNQISNLTNIKMI